MSDHVTQTVESHRKLLAAVGHDLRTPLAAMRLYAEFVDDETVRERLHCDLNELQSVTENIFLAARSNNNSRGTAALESMTG
jgi:signal transduction histidine kinase